MEQKTKEIIVSFYDLLGNRRVWAGIVGFTGFLLTVLGIEKNLNVETWTELLANLGSALAMLIPAILAIWSFLHPKK